MDGLKVYKYNYRINNKLLFLFIFIISFINYSLCIECPRDKPISKNDICLNIYCQPEEYENNICTISNPFIKSQWLNNIQYFTSEGISKVSTTSNLNGDLFLIAQGITTENNSNKYIFAFNKDGIGLFPSKNNLYESFKTIDFPESKYPEIFYSVNIEQKDYLLSSPINKEIILIDYNNNKFTTFNLDSSSYFSDEYFILKGYNNNDNENDTIYFNDYIYCKDLVNNDCYLGLRIFKLDLSNFKILVEKNEEIQINYLSKINCFQNEDLYIQCIYTTKEKTDDGIEKYNHVVSLFNNTNLKMEYNEILQENYNKENTFDSTLLLNGNFFVTGFSLPNNKNIIKLLFKKFIINKSNSNNVDFKLVDYIPNVPFIDINEDNQYILDKGFDKKNNMIKISENKF